MSLKLFISYSTAGNASLAGDLKRHFEEYDMIKCFVAHDDISHGIEWEKEILANLDSSDFFMPIQTEHIKTFFWCQQEAGYALAKSIKIVPLIPDIDGTDPVGFYARFQGFKIKTQDLRSSVKWWLIKEGTMSKEVDGGNIGACPLRVCIKTFG